MSLDHDLRNHLDHLQAQVRLRRTRALGGSDRTRPTEGGRALLAFCSNDYLGLASHPALAAAAAVAARDHGFGSGASRLVAGESPLHAALEQSLATFAGQPAALLFPTGYQANLGVLTSLASSADLIASDAANHASIIDGCRLSRATVAIYRHGDAADARRALATSGSFRRRLLVTESVFSMDGDRAPLADLASIADAAGASLVVDEAHAFGVAGPRGRGLCAQAGVVPAVLVATLGKAFGAAGGFAATSDTVRSFLVNQARTFIFTTAPPHPVAGAALAALQIIDSATGDDLRAQAAERASALRAALSHGGFALPGSDLILPLTLGSDRRAVRVADRLHAEGLVIPAIRPPTVPEGTARLRITVSAAHTPADVVRLAGTLLDVLGSE
jgi:8-amino-7-oxononanoate synthase